MASLKDTDKLIELIDDDIAAHKAGYFEDFELPPTAYGSLCALRMVREYIKALPTVEAEPIMMCNGEHIKCPAHKDYERGYKDGQAEAQMKAEPIKHAHDLMDKARYFYCSECGYAVADVFEGAYHHDERVRIFEEGRSWNYCPNCGARMDGGEDEQIEQSKGSRL